MLRWEDVDDSKNDHGLAIDNLKIYAMPHETSGIMDIDSRNNDFYNMGAKFFFNNNLIGESIQIFNLSGRIVYQSYIHSANLDVKNQLVKGVYFAIVDGVVKKIII